MTSFPNVLQNYSEQSKVPYDNTYIQSYVIIMWFCNVGLYPDNGDLLFFFFSFGGQSRKSFCIFLFVICWQKGALKKIFSLAADFHLWKRLSPNLTLWQKLCTHFAKQIWNLWSCLFLDGAVICECVWICSFLSICNFLDDSANFLCTFCVRQRERESVICWLRLSTQTKCQIFCTKQILKPTILYLILKHCQRHNGPRVLTL